MRDGIYEYPHYRCVRWQGGAWEVREVHKGGYIVKWLAPTLPKAIEYSRLNFFPF